MTLQRLGQGGAGVVRSFDLVTVAIANGQTKSEPFGCGGAIMFGMALPAAFTGTAMTFEVSADNGTYQPLCDYTGAAVSMTVAQGKSYDLPGALAAWPYAKLVSGTAEGGARSVVIVAKG